MKDILQRSRNSGNGGGGSYADGVRMEEIVEGTVGALHILAREGQNRYSWGDYRGNSQGSAYPV
jgi:hypothetical protein